MSLPRSLLLPSPAAGAPDPTPRGPPMASPVPKPAHEALKPSEKKALAELRLLLEQAIASSNILTPPSHHHHHHHHHKWARVVNPVPDPNQQDLTDIELWGVPLLPSKSHEGTNAVLLKFLRASEYKALEALEMIQRTLQWRKEFGIDSISGGRDSDDGQELDGLAYLNGVNRDGQPVRDNMFGVFKEKDSYINAFENEEMREKFLMSRVQLMGKGVRELSFRSRGVGSMLQVIDLKESSIASMKELRHIVKSLYNIVDDNNPEFAGQHIFINVSFRHYAYKAMLSRTLSQRTRSSFIFARPSRVTETLLKHVSPENIPVQYGGLQREVDDEFSEKDGRASEMCLKGGSTATVEIPITEPGVTVVWDLAVVGWDVHYQEEFIPDDEGSYVVLIRKEKRLDENARNSFYISEPGKVVLTVTNRTFKKKMILYRSKSKPTVPLYNLVSNAAE